MPECQIKRKRDLGRVKWRKRETGIVSIAHTHTHIHTHTHTNTSKHTGHAGAKGASAGDSNTGGGRRNGSSGEP